MPRISTDNYDTVASWNGSQDLFVVEQPDGTKVATPAMVKQFIEAGTFEATGEVKDGNGNILSNIAGQVSDLNDEIATINGKFGNVTPNMITISADSFPYVLDLNRLPYLNNVPYMLNLVGSNNSGNIYGSCSFWTMNKYARTNNKYQFKEIAFTGGSSSAFTFTVNESAATLTISVANSIGVIRGSFILCAKTNW